MSANSPPSNIDNNNNIPSTHILIHKSQLSILKMKADKYDRLMNHLSQVHYMGSALGNAMLGFAASIVPQCGYTGLAKVIPFIIGSLFANINITIDFEKLVDSQPSGHTIQRLVAQNAVDTVLLTQKAYEIIFTYISHQIKEIKRE